MIDMNNPLSVEKLENKVRYKNVTVVPVGNEKFPTMVMIEKAPAKLKEIKGKKYITPEKAQIAIELLSAEALIKNGAKKVNAELDSVGILIEPSAW
jgi:glucan phosphorylase